MIRAIIIDDEQESRNTVVNILNNFCKNIQIIAQAENVKEGLRFIILKDIIRCEADSNYTNFFLNSGEKVLVTKTLKEYDETLSGLDFIRVHQSHLVNSKYIERYIKGEGGTIIMTDGSEVEVSRRRKEEFLKKMTEK